jgi:hypothetical protein
MSESVTYIYVLKDPVNNDVRYVGKSDKPKERIIEHIRKSKYKKTYKNIWIQKLIKEGRKSLSEKRKGVKNPMFGKKQSKNCIEGKYKQVNQYDLNVDFIKSWKSLKEVSEYLSINRNSIRMCANNQRKSAGGYKWKFK